MTSEKKQVRTIKHKVKVMSMSVQNDDLIITLADEQSGTTHAVIIKDKEEQQLFILKGELTLEIR